MTPAAKPDYEALADKLDRSFIGKSPLANECVAALKAAGQYERQREELRTLLDHPPKIPDDATTIYGWAADLLARIRAAMQFDTPAKGEPNDSR